MKLPKYIKVVSGFCKQANVTTYEGRFTHKIRYITVERTKQ